MSSGQQSSRKGVRNNRQRSGPRTSAGRNGSEVTFLTAEERNLEPLVAHPGRECDCLGKLHLSIAIWCLAFDDGKGIETTMRQVK